MKGWKRQGGGASSPLGVLSVKDEIKEKSDGRDTGSSRLLSLSLSIYFPLCC